MASLTIMMVLILFHHKSSFAKDVDPMSSCSSSCGPIHNITHPFRLTTDPLSCGDLRFNLSCENNHAVVYLPKRYYGKKQRFYVEAINYNNYTIRVVDPNIQKDYCSSLPNNTLVPSFFYYSYYYETIIRFASFRNGFKKTRRLTETVILLNCESKVRNPSYISAAPCTFHDAFSEVTNTSHSYHSYYYVLDVEEYYHVFDEEQDFEWEPRCRLVQTTLISKREKDSNTKKNSFDIQNALVYGFELSWVRSFNKTGEGNCMIDDEDSYRVHCYWPNWSYKRGLTFWISTFLYYLFVYKARYKYVVGLLTPRTTVGVSFVIGLLIYKWRRRHLAMHDGIEEFLQSHANLMPIRYSYRNIRKMTKGFKEKLGEGGFGSVYRGKLSSGRLVAIKMLGNSGANGQDFINEVATIGRIHHVNVVRLVGFCVEGSKRALVYDFMCNGSLDKYIFSREGMDNSLSYEEIFEISLGVARGMEYLHRGCDMQILHFDIKPHNILLGESFIPKVSDFGLARLCPLDNSIVSLTAARGTIGYIAPELFYKNIGGVSYKADVYSFGMLLMEMANRRKNVNANAEKTSQIYFPTWIYDQFSKGNGMDIEDATEEESKTMKKMIIVALWCIQLKPCDRPSMNKVIEMLEGEVECLQMPPKPYLYPQEQEQEKHDVMDAAESSRSSKLSEEDSPESSLISSAY